MGHAWNGWQERARRTVSGQEAEPVCWITREQLTRVEDEGEDAWVYWAETGHVAEPDEVALYAAPIPATVSVRPLTVSQAPTSQYAMGWNDCLRAIAATEPK
jgi:hypothetical protein